MPLVIHGLGSGHTDTHVYIHTEVILKNQAHAPAPGQCVPGLTKCWHRKLWEIGYQPQVFSCQGYAIWYILFAQIILQLAQHMGSPQQTS